MTLRWRNWRARSRPLTGRPFTEGRSGDCCATLARHTKKDLHAVEQKRPEVAAARHIWITRRQPFMANMLTRIGFIDETSIKTNMAKTTGWVPRGERLIEHAPFGH